MKFNTSMYEHWSRVAFRHATMHGSQDLIDWTGRAQAEGRSICESASTQAEIDDAAEAMKAHAKKMRHEMMVKRGLK